MGIADSPFRDRVLFIEGAPRSGTTWLATLLASHPSIAGVSSEAHLFDMGVDRLFDNFEGTSKDVARYSYVSSYVSRPQLADLARDLCDGVLGSMRDAVKPDVPYVLEKTPLALADPWLQLRRKLEVYPDAWYLHIVRDGEAVTRSLLRTPFASHLTPAECRRWWRDSVAALRDVVGDHERYREVAYDEMSADAVGTVRQVVEWVGLDLDEAVARRMEELSRQRVAQFKAPSDEPGRELGRLGYLGLSARDLVTRGVGRARRIGGGGPAPEAAPRAATVLLQAARSGDTEALRQATTDSFVLEVRSPDGDMSESGDGARHGLRSLLAGMFDRSYVAEGWNVEAEAVEFYALTGDGGRVDVAFLCTLDGERVARLKAIFAESPASGA